jgi:hypothetical protein
MQRIETMPALLRRPSLLLVLMGAALTACGGKLSLLARPR